MFARIATVSLLILAALAAPARAATVVITPSTTTPGVGENFTLTVTADVGNTFAATLGLAFDATKVAYVSGAALAPWNVFVKNTPVDDNPTVFDVETPSATAANPGVYDVAILTFQALAGGAAGIVIDDDGGLFSGWFDADTADYIPVDYVQATVDIVVNGPAVEVTDSVDPASDLALPFGEVQEGTTSIGRTFTVKNVGNQALVIGLVADADFLDLPFALTADTCTGMSLPPASACILTIDFSPTSTGDFADTFDLPSNAPATVELAVSGTGVGAPAPDAVVTDSITPASDLALPFGNVGVGANATATLTVTNGGNASLTLGQVATANPLVAPFSILADDCSGQVVPAAANCQVQVRFEPTATGPFTDSLDIPSDDPDQPSIAITVTGTGTTLPVPDIAITDEVDPAGDLEVAFGDVGAGTTATRTVTVTNAGTANLAVGTVADADPLAPPYQLLTDNCSGRSLAPAATCTVVIRFTPGAPTGFNDSFSIPSNDPDESTVTVQVSGTGVVVQEDGGSSALDPATALLLAALAAGARRRRGRASPG